MHRPGTRALQAARLRAGQATGLSVIIPTRNEAGNIRPLLARLRDALADIDAEVLIIDDSDDATPEIARQAASLSALPIRVYDRPPEQRPGGLGGAVVAGLSEACGSVCVVMDADLQHPPELIGMLLRASRAGADFAVASRYLNGGRADGLGGAYRRAVSTLATQAAKRLLRPELTGISDPMSGFFLVRRSCLDLGALHPQGFKLLLELLVHNPQATVAEVPYTFDVRHSGVSKARISEGLTYLGRLIELRTQARRAPQRTWRRHVLVGTALEEYAPTMADSQADLGRGLVRTRRDTGGLNDAMPAMWREDTRRRVELHLMPHERLLGESALRGSRRHTTTTRAECPCEYAVIPAPCPRTCHERARGPGREGRAQGAPDRPPGYAR